MIMVHEVCYRGALTVAAWPVGGLCGGRVDNVRSGLTDVALQHQAVLINRGASRAAHPLKVAVLLIR